MIPSWSKEYIWSVNNIKILYYEKSTCIIKFVFVLGLISVNAQDAPKKVAKKAPAKKAPAKKVAAKKVPAKKAPAKKAPAKKVAAPTPATSA